MLRAHGFEVERKQEEGIVVGRRDDGSLTRVPAQIVSGTISIAPHGHSATQMPQPLQ